MKSPYAFLNSNDATKNSWLACGAKKELLIRIVEANVLEKIQRFIDDANDYVFGYFSYDLKNEIEQLHSHNPNYANAPLAHLFVPEEALINPGAEMFSLTENNSTRQAIQLQARTSKADYLAAVGKLKEHIQLGDIYEVNYCIEFFSKSKLDDPFHVYTKLNSLTEAPFSAYMYLGDLHLMCASPERFLKRNGDRVISQPIKGTIRRGKTADEDLALKTQLRNNPKEQSENVMIVDLVRNDLSRNAVRGSVHVDELFGVHSFKTVHQMISTISCEVLRETSFVQLLKNTFPMGSMTGAPKIRAMQLIDEFETQSRGIYSGCVGYIAPNGDFDFNVVIRSIIYNEKNNHLSAMVGSAITAQSDADAEYEECLLKVDALQKALS